MVPLLLWLILLVLAPLLALIVLVLYPLIWLLALPLRLIGISVAGVFALLSAALHLPARLIRGPGHSRDPASS